MPIGESAETILLHEKRLQDMAKDQKMPNPQTVSRLMSLTFGVRRNMLIEQMKVDGKLQNHAVTDIVDRFPFIIHEKYVGF